MVHFERAPPTRWISTARDSTPSQYDRWTIKVQGIVALTWVIKPLVPSMQLGDIKTRQLEKQTDSIVNISSIMTIAMFLA